MSESPSYSVVTLEGTAVTSRRTLIRIYFGINEASCCDQPETHPGLLLPGQLPGKSTRHLVFPLASFYFAVLL